MCGHTTAQLLPLLNSSDSSPHKRLVQRVLLRKLSAHYPLSQSMLSGETSYNTPSLSPPSRIFEIERVFLTLVLNYLPSAVFSHQVLLLVTTNFVADSFPRTVIPFCSSRCPSRGLSIQRATFPSLSYVSIPSKSPTPGYNYISELLKHCRQLKAVSTKYD